MRRVRGITVWRVRGITVRSERGCIKEGLILLVYFSPCTLEFSGQHCCIIVFWTALLYHSVLDSIGVSSCSGQHCCIIVFWTALLYRSVLDSIAVSSCSRQHCYIIVFWTALLYHCFLDSIVLSLGSGQHGLTGLLVLSSQILCCVCDAYRKIIRIQIFLLSFKSSINSGHVRRNFNLFMSCFIPGPGAYDSHGHVAKGGLMITRDKRFRQDMEDFPGPGTYEVRPGSVSV